MLDGLDRIPWGSLHHARGPAHDIPQLLLALADPRPRVHDRAHDELYDTLFCRGVRYPASAPAASFLLDLVELPQVPRRFDLLAFLARLVAGYHSIRSEPTYHDGENLFVSGQRVPAAKIPADQRPHAALMASIYRTVASRSGTAVAFLRHPDARVRASAAHLLSTLPTCGPVAPLRSALATELDPAVRAQLLFALSRLDVLEPLRAALDDPEEVVAAMATTALATRDPDPSLIPRLAALLERRIDLYPGLRGADEHSCTADAALLLLRYPPAVSAELAPVLCTALGGANGMDCIPIVEAMLHGGFPLARKRLKQVSPLQRSLLVAFVQHDDVWVFTNLIESFASRGLKLDREKTAALGKIPFVEDVPRVHLRNAKWMVGVGQYDGGLSFVEQALSADPTVLDRDPNPASAWLAYAQLLAHANRREEALLALRRAEALTTVDVLLDGHSPLALLLVNAPALGDPEG